ncbi:unnamed protein product [Nesidiocoris tenuis]|uniref:Uncharacterized protein n=1 Tax=Nesidiocoris tenuis TaxID=355587 RepID=A0A6H5G7A9_9HEMI|nr:unnamed protein product [Nesidiocoris tenuis]
MSDRVVDECNPDAHLSIKEVTSLCWDDKADDTEVKDFTDMQDQYIDVVIQKVLQRHSKLLSKEPFAHESLLVDRKEKKLSQAEKRLAKRSYELEKQASGNNRPVYQNNIVSNQGGVIRAPLIPSNLRNNSAVSITPRGPMTSISGAGPGRAFTQISLGHPTSQSVNSRLAMAGKSDESDGCDSTSASPARPPPSPHHDSSCVSAKSFISLLSHIEDESDGDPDFPVRKDSSGDPDVSGKTDPDISGKTHIQIQTPWKDSSGDPDAKFICFAFILPLIFRKSRNEQPARPHRIPPGRSVEKRSFHNAVFERPSGSRTVWTPTFGQEPDKDGFSEGVRRWRIRSSASATARIRPAAAPAPDNGASTVRFGFSRFDPLLPTRSSRFVLWSF